MLLTEALKLIGKKPASLTAEIADRIMKIHANASAPSDVTRLTYGTPDQQREKVKELVQGATDQARRLGKLRHAVAVVNATTELEIQIGKETVKQTVDAWIVRKDQGIVLERQILGALKPANLGPTPRTMDKPGSTTGEKELVVAVRFYDEAEKDKRLQELLEEERAINSALDKFNVTTEIPANLLLG